MEASGREASLKVRVERVIHADGESGFAVMRVRALPAGESFVAAGLVGTPPRPEQLFELEGAFEEHPRFGRRFRIERALLQLPADPEGIRRYLASGLVAGIGPRLAERLLAAFGSDTLRILEEEPERAREVSGVGKKKAAQLARCFRGEREQRQALVFLQGLGLGANLSLAIWRALGSNTLRQVREDPYGLCQQVRGIGFLTADRLAASLGIRGDHPTRLKAGLRHILQGALDQGQLCLEKEELLSRGARLLALQLPVLAQALKGEVGEGRLRAEVPCLPGFAPPPPVRIHLPCLLEMEEEARDRLLALAAAPRQDPPPLRRPRGPGICLNDAQKKGVELLLREKVALLTGGPGVGKTTVLREVVFSYQVAGFQVALACPTGRAARRLCEATGFEAKTLHRLFGFIPGLPGARHRGPEGLDVMVIDEASMLDLPLFLRVLRAVGREVILILVGDADQLPPVGPGRVLADLLESRRFPTVSLARIYRQDRQGLIVENAHRIHRGLLPLQPKAGAEGDFFFIRSPDPIRGAALMEKLFLERMPQRFGLDPAEDIQILAPMHRGPAGVDALNKRLQQALHGEAPALIRGQRRFLQGDRVMQTRNDYDLGLMNGDLGRVLRVDPQRGRLLVLFEGREVELSNKALDSVQLAFAMTVHKSQGGEFPAVLMPLFSDHLLMLKRNVLYTALTRAQQLMVLVGTEKALRVAVRDDRLQRRLGSFPDLIRGHALRLLGPQDL